ncbi:hypothetical protein BEL04_08280 [Mucilaginibacter sp. PPCGB 2223]|uniref:hypothetical protein n=1 Tax=Mucilaginibacter sp. PPCGB 2223 TaxID=1886027 RepID=UPI000824A193|nr:hypothetical protein [Mucilaginibacter sp. PPCGB 2223]OCX54244.1 hypothetical protein BEL04_08280 [Mucilaginibacter sp. PPCGB 2223]
MTKIEFTLPKLKQISNDIAVLKSCPAIPFQVAIKIHGNIFAIDAAINKLEGEIEVIREQLKEFNKSEPTPEQQYEYAAKAEEQAQQIANKKVSVNIDVVSKEAVEGITIDGEKEVSTQAGTVKFNYRDAYFNLVYFGIIAA